MSCDPAGGQGGDRTVLSYLRGNCIFKVECFSNMSETDAIDYIIERMYEYKVKPENCAIDVTGLGAGLGNGLQKRGFDICKFVAGAASTKVYKFYQFYNQKAEAAWNLRIAMQNGLRILDRADIEKDILMPRYSTEDQKTIRIESKADLKKRSGGKSSDIFDSLAMTVFLSENYFIETVKNGDWSQCVFEPTEMQRHFNKMDEVPENNYLDNDYLSEAFYQDSLLGHGLF